MTTLMKANQQWASRPDDERFTSLDALYGHVNHLRNASSGKVVSSRQLEARPDPNDSVTGIEVFGPNGHGFAPTHYAFGQLAARAGAPAGYLRTLPAPIACDAINYGLRFGSEAEDMGVLISRANDEPVLRAVTGPNYGRIWNRQVVDQLRDRFGDGVTGDWRVPGEFGKAVEVTKANTTLYAGDRDMFVFLADEANRIELPNRRAGLPGSLARGFFVWNSEVGAATLGVGMFLFDYVCSNRMVWGATQYKEVRVRHTSAAPDRWLEEVAPALKTYRESSVAPIEAMLLGAQAKRVDDLAEFLKTRRFAANMAGKLQAIHEAEEGRPVETLWDISTALTALARDIPHQDVRVALERQAGDILDLAA